MRELFYTDEFITLWNGDCRDILPELEAESVQCVVTSPPFYGLRDYGTATWQGGSVDCNHLGEPMRTRAFVNQNCGTGNDVKNSSNHQFYKNVCGKCGAVRVDNQIGLEQTPQEFIETMVAVFDSVRNVLRPNGTLWLNLGDSYSGSNGNGYKQSIHTTNNSIGQQGSENLRRSRYRTDVHFKAKDLMMMPHRTAIALQDAGWWVRQDIVWAKPSPMPESVLDRCTKAHEYIFLCAKNEKYFFDSNAIREKTGNEADWSNYQATVRRSDDLQNFGMSNHKGAGLYGNRKTLPDGRNKRSVWTIASKPYAEAHFATFPPEIPEICIKAGSPVGGVVLDPFAGAGTTLMMAKKLGRKAIGIELNPKYCELIVQRIKREATLPLFERTENAA